MYSVTDLLLLLEKKKVCEVNVISFHVLQIRRYCKEFGPVCDLPLCFPNCNKSSHCSLDTALLVN